MINTDPQENLRADRRLGRVLRAQGKRVVYDAEHFFDGYRDDAEYALLCLDAALDAGAENVTLCDTNGSSLPHEITARDRARWSSASAPRWSGSTPTTTPSAGWRTRSPRWGRAPLSCRAP